MEKNKTITVESLVHVPAKRAWEIWTEPEHIMKWNQASADWRCPKAENDLRVGGRFSSRMEAKDGSEGFDFGGTYREVVPGERIAYTADDGREVEIDFQDEGDETRITETFEPESENPEEMQKAGWQAILDSFKRYAENK